MIIGAHTIVYSKDADADRAFFRDVLGFAAIDAGQGWLIFQLPPAELAVHPAQDNGRHEIYLMCNDVEATVRKLQSKRIACRPVTDEGWGLLTSLTLPGGGAVGLYQPRHPTALGIS
jgi:catechol 2,3-dioxygenase-like lactoylglutathione lyase family enzyme